MRRQGPVRRVLVRETDRPRDVAASLCVCSHVGDCKAPLSMHEGVNGHGRCMIRGCRCRQFAWVGFLCVEEDDSDDNNQR